MPTLSEVQRQIKALGDVGKFNTKKEIKYLPEILAEDETVLALTSGLMDGNTWLIVCTPKRVIFLDKGMIYGLKQRETFLERINSVEQKTGMIFGSLGIWDGATCMTIKNVMKKTVKPFVEAVNRARDALKIAEGSIHHSVAPPTLIRDERECPHCAELILKKAKMCKHCGGDVTNTKTNDEPAHVPSEKDRSSPRPPASTVLPSSNIAVTCTCGARLKAKRKLIGKTVPCPKCKKPLKIKNSN